MTAIDKYTRLEALGQWRESPDQPPREVVVSFENATLVLSDLEEKPLCHWAMAATFRLKLDGTSAVYTPDTEGFETLEIDDAEMVEAIAQVSLAAVTITRRTPWLRWVLFVSLMGIIGTMFYSTPILLRAQAIRMTALESARKLGTDMVTTLDTDICREPRGDIARALFQSRVFPEGSIILLISRGQDLAGAFPGGVVLIDDPTLQSMQSPNELAALTIALAAQSETTLTQLFEASSPRELFQYITSGKLSEERLAKAAQNTISKPNVDNIADFTAPNQPLLRDQDWVALQGICLD